MSRWARDTRLRKTGPRCSRPTRGRSLSIPTTPGHTSIWRWSCSATAVLPRAGASPWRWRWKDFSDRPRNFSQPQWRGEALDGARILLHAEQGHGDTIQFARYASLVADRGGTVLVEVQRPLVRLLAHLPGVAGIIARGDRLPPFAWHCPLLSLPLALDTVLETIPARVPYVTAAPVPLEPQSAAPSAGGLRIGLVWAGSPAHLRDERRSIPLGLFAPLTRIGGTTWYSLHMDPRPAR